MSEECCGKIKVGHSLFEYSKNEKGEFIYKSVDSLKKKDGTLKKQYKEMPRFDVLLELDKQAEKDSNLWHKSVSKIVRDKLLEDEQ